MASRLYGITRALYSQVLQLLSQLEVRRWGSPTAVALLALYVTGLILLDVHQTQTEFGYELPSLVSCPVVAMTPSTDCCG